MLDILFLSDVIVSSFEVTVDCRLVHRSCSTEIAAELITPGWEDEDWRCCCRGVPSSLDESEPELDEDDGGTLIKKPPNPPPAELPNFFASNSAASVVDKVKLSALILLLVSSGSLSPMNLEVMTVSRTPNEKKEMITIRINRKKKRNEKK